MTIVECALDKIHVNLHVVERDNIQLMHNAFNVMLGMGHAYSAYSANKHDPLNMVNGYSILMFCPYLRCTFT